MKDEQIIDLIHEIDPARGHDVVPAGQLDSRAEADLAKILAGKRRRIGWPQWAVVVTAVVAVAATSLVIARPWSVGQEAPVIGTPPVLRFQKVDDRPAPTQLLEFARRVRALPPEPATGPVLRIATKWGGGKAEQDSSGKMTAYFDTESPVRFVLKGGLYAQQEDGEVLGPSPVQWPEGASSDPATLRTQLIKDRPGGASPRGQFISAVLDLQRESIPGPGVRAAVLTLMSEQAGVIAEGTTIDRIGRLTVGYSLPDDYGTLHTWLFDAKTGVLLDAEEVFLGVELDPSPHTPATRRTAKPTAPTVTGYEIFTSRDYVAKIPR